MSPSAHDDLVEPPNHVGRLRLYPGVRAVSTAREPAAASSNEEFWEWLLPHWEAMSRTAARFCARSDVADVLHDAALQAWRKRSLYDPERGSPNAWLVAITYDQARRRWRRALRTATVSQVPEVGAEEESFITTRLDVENAVRGLSRRQREAVYLYYYVDLSVEDISSVLHCSPGTVKSTLHDARRALARSIRGRGES